MGDEGRGAEVDAAEAGCGDASVSARGGGQGCDAGAAAGSAAGAAHSVAGDCGKAGDTADEFVFHGRAGAAGDYRDGGAAEGGGGDGVRGGVWDCAEGWIDAGGAVGTADVVRRAGRAGVECEGERAGGEGGDGGGGGRDLKLGECFICARVS